MHIFGGVRTPPGIDAPVHQWNFLIHTKPSKALDLKKAKKALDLKKA